MPTEPTTWDEAVAIAKTTLISKYAIAHGFGIKSPEEEAFLETLKTLATQDERWALLSKMQEFGRAVSPNQDVIGQATFDTVYTAIYRHASDIATLLSLLNDYVQKDSFLYFSIRDKFQEILYRDSIQTTTPRERMGMCVFLGTAILRHGGDTTYAILNDIIQDDTLSVTNLHSVIACLPVGDEMWKNTILRLHDKVRKQAQEQS